MLRSAFLAALAAMFQAAPISAQTVAADPPAKASVRLLKPLVLEKRTDLYFGTVMVGDVVGTQTLTMDPITGDLDGCDNGVTCLGPAQRAAYFVYGTSGERVTIRSSPSTLTSATGETLAFTPIHQNSVLIPEDPFVGNFQVGGSITLSAATVDGFYQGDVTVTVEY